jgi:non-heme chloroperoxidase
MIHQSRAALGRPSFIEVEKNVSLHITDLGEGSPIVLIHGLPFSNAMFEYQYQYLSKAGYRVIGISLRGFGLSDKPYGTYNYDVFADDIKTVFETLEIEDAVLGGFSMGAAAAIRYTIRYNAAHISKLALFSAAIPFLAEKPSFLKLHADELVRLNNSDRPAFLKMLSQLLIDGNPFISSNVNQWFSNIHLQISSYAMEQCLILLRDADLYSDLKKINVYTAIFHGMRDRICPFDLSERLYSAIPRSYFVPFENSGHMLVLEEMEKFNSTFLKFLRFANVRQAQLIN